MPSCCVCGNDYAEAFTVTLPDGASFVFDSFECAIDKVAPRCGHCGCRIVGHGIQVEATAYCSAHCVRSRTTADISSRLGS